MYIYIIIILYYRLNPNTTVNAEDKRVIVSQSDLCTPRMKIRRDRQEQDTQ